MITAYIALSTKMRTDVITYKRFLFCLVDLISKANFDYVIFEVFCIWLKARFKKKKLLNGFFYLNLCHGETYLMLLSISLNNSLNIRHIRIKKILQ